MYTVSEFNGLTYDFILQPLVRNNVKLDEFAGRSIWTGNCRNETAQYAYVHNYIGKYNSKLFLSYPSSLVDTLYSFHDTSNASK